MVSGYESQETRAIVLGGRVVVRATKANQDVIQLHGALLKGFFVEKLPIFSVKLFLLKPDKVCFLFFSSL